MTANYWVLLLDPIGPQQAKNSPHFMSPECCFCVHKSPLVTLSWARQIQSMPSHPVSLRYILILSSHLCLDFPHCLSPSGFPTKTLYALLLSPIYATSPSHLMFLDFVNLIIIMGECKDYEALHYAVFSSFVVTSSLISPSIFLSTV